MFSKKLFLALAVVCLLALPAQAALTSLVNGNFEADRAAYDAGSGYPNNVPTGWYDSGMSLIAQNKTWGEHSSFYQNWWDETGSFPNTTLTANFSNFDTPGRAMYIYQPIGTYDVGMSPLQVTLDAIKLGVNLNDQDSASIRVSIWKTSASATGAEGTAISTLPGAVQLSTKLYNPADAGWFLANGSPSQDYFWAQYRTVTTGALALTGASAGDKLWLEISGGSGTPAGGSSDGRTLLDNVVVANYVPPPHAGPATAYFRGNVSASWQDLNWSATAAGSGNLSDYPGTNTEVNFSTSNVNTGNLNTTLDSVSQVKSVQLTGPTVSIAPGSGSGVLTMTGNGSGNSLMVDNGTLNLTGGTYNAAGSVFMGNFNAGGVLNLSGSAKLNLTDATKTLNIGNNNGNCSMTVSGNSVVTTVTNEVNLGYAGGGAGQVNTLTLSGNAVFNQASTATLGFYVARGGAAGTSDVLNIQDNAVLNTSRFTVGLIGATGTVNQTGGAVNATFGGAGGSARIGANGTTGTYNISGGSYNLGAGGFILRPGFGAGSVGTLNISGTGQVNMASDGYVELGNTGGNGTVNLDGGSLKTWKITKGTGTGTVNLNGGVLKAAASEANFMTGLTAANVKENGAKIDSNGYTVSIGQILAHDPGLEAGDGGLVKQGLGTVTLTAANTYTGSTTVEAGTLALSSSGWINNSQLVDVKAGATLDISSKGGYHLTAGKTLMGSGVVLGALLIDSGATHSPGASPGIETVAGDYTMSGTLVAEIEGSTAGTGHDQVLVSDTTDRSASLSGVLSLVWGGSGWSSGTDKLWIVRNDTAGALSGMFSNYAASGMSVGNHDGREWQIFYGADAASGATTGGNDVLIAAAVPEPSTLVLLASGLLALACCAWRKRK